MKRLPLVASFLLFIVLCASLAYWSLQLFRPPLRPVAAPPRLARVDVAPDAAAALFGGRPGKVAVASNYQLKGVIMSGTANDSVAILSADGKPAQAVRVDMEIAPGVTVREVHRDYVLLSASGAPKRVDLPENAGAQASLVPVPGPPIATPGPTAPPPTTGRAQAAQPHAPTQSTNARSPLLPPPAPAALQQPQAQQQQQAQQNGQAQAGQMAPPTVVVSPPPSSQATQAGGNAASAQQQTRPAAPAATPVAPAANPPSVAPSGTAQNSGGPVLRGPESEMRPPTTLQSR